MYDHDDERKSAVRRIENRRAFVTHIVTFVVVITLLVVIWAVNGGGYFWPVWPMAGWGIGLALHAWSVFGQRPITDEDIQREMHRGA